MTSGKKIHSWPANRKGVDALDIMKIMGGVDKILDIEDQYRRQNIQLIKISEKKYRGMFLEK